MHRIVEFITNHWVLVSLFVILLIAYVTLESASGSLGCGVSPQEVIQMMNNKGAMVIDVRDSQTFKKGHLIGSKNITADVLQVKMTAGNKNKENPIILVCDSGKNTPPLATNLKRAGFKNVFLLLGGIDQWKKQELPLVAVGGEK